MNVFALLINRTVVAALAMATAWKTAFLARSYKAVKLFKTNAIIGPTTTLAGLVEADFDGYVPVAVSALNGPNLDSLNNAYVNTNAAEFQCTGNTTPNQIYSAGLVGTLAGGTAATATVTTTGGVISAPVITLAGGPYQAPPQISVAGGGTGAKVVATIDGDGAVDTVTVVDGGSGYTAATLVFEPPVELIGGQTIPAAQPMMVSTDALAVVLQQNIPAGA